MKTAKEICNFFDDISQKRKQEILNAPDTLCVKGAKYYVSNEGSDQNDGLSPEAPWKTLNKVSSAKLNEGDGVFFKRGDLFRGNLRAQSGVSYGAFGQGDKPKFYGWDKDLCVAELWECVYPENNIWKLKEKILDCGTLVFNHGEKCSYKLIPSFFDGKFYCRDNDEKLFDMRDEMLRDLDIYWHYDEELTTAFERTGTMPVPKINTESMGELYLRCDGGNPASCFSSIEAIPFGCLITAAGNPNVTIDNLCIKYANFAVGGGGRYVEGLTVQNCEIGWIGGAIQCYYGADPNYTLMNKRGRVTRYGNGIEIYGGCKNYTVHNNYFYEIYDAAITHQITTCGNPVIMENIFYTDNVVENTVYSIEYFLDTDERDTVSFMENVTISGNILTKAGYGWGIQRPNKYEAAHIKGWPVTNRAKNYKIENNILDRSTHRLIHILAEDEASLPVMNGNTYVQHSGGLLGTFGTDKNNLHFFGEPAKTVIEEELGDKNAKVYNLE